jgi:hypothetical protein
LAAPVSSLAIAEEEDGSGTCVLKATLERGVELNFAVKHRRSGWLQFDDQEARSWDVTNWGLVSLVGGARTASGEVALQTRIERAAVEGRMMQLGVVSGDSGIVSEAERRDAVDSLSGEFRRAAVGINGATFVILLTPQGAAKNVAGYEKWYGETVRERVHDGYWRWLCRGTTDKEELLKWQSLWGTRSEGAIRQGTSWKAVEPMATWGLGEQTLKSDVVEVAASRITIVSSTDVKRAEKGSAKGSPTSMDVEGTVSRSVTVARTDGLPLRGRLVVERRVTSDGDAAGVVRTTSLQRHSIVFERIDVDDVERLRGGGPWPNLSADEVCDGDK